MVRARLHIICGNCGCNDYDMFSYKTFHATDADDKPVVEVQIVCDNCSTIHNLGSSIKEAIDN